VGCGTHRSAAAAGLAASEEGWALHDALRPSAHPPTSKRSLATPPRTTKRHGSVSLCAAWQQPAKDGVGGSRAAASGGGGCLGGGQAAQYGRALLPALVKGHAAPGQRSCSTTHWVPRWRPPACFPGVCVARGRLRGGGRQLSMGVGGEGGPRRRRSRPPLPSSHARSGGAAGWAHKLPAAGALKGAAAGPAAPEKSLAKTLLRWRMRVATDCGGGRLGVAGVPAAAMRRPMAQATAAAARAVVRKMTGTMPGSASMLLTAVAATSMAARAVGLRFGRSLKIEVHAGTPTNCCVAARQPHREIWERSATCSKAQIPGRRQGSAA
jgi:hypothetical protein